MISVNFILPDGQKITTSSIHVQSLLEVAWQNQLPIEGTCSGTMACSTCHLFVDSQWGSRLKKPHEEELAMLDLAVGVTEWSRLGCQIKLTDELDGITVALPGG
ncbi:MAG: 2Fe-2S iron-sulfur cluster-binding protein [Rhodospirillaceae bacterium]